MITLIHGFNVHEPDETIGKLKKYIPSAIMYNYGWRLLSVLWYNKRDAKILRNNLNNALDVDNERIVYGHSNGCAIAVEAARQGAIIDTLVCINPALKCDTIFPSTIKHVIVIHTMYDTPTKIAKFFDDLPLIGLFIPNAWGAMGAHGYTGTDRRVRNIDLSSWLDGHSAFFDDYNLDLYMPELISLTTGV